MAPATRSALIIAGLFLGGFGLATFWIAKEAQRLHHAKELTRAANARVLREGGGDMALVPAGKFIMGANDGAEDERPLHDVKIRAFWMDKTEVTNAQFARFVKETRYVTTAERQPGLSAATAAGAMTFTPRADVHDLHDEKQWWTFAPDANWRHPSGPDSHLINRDNYPVVQISWEDAEAFARWAGKRLPTEAEWEYAARGGMEHEPFMWGREQVPDGKWMANLWQGPFPAEDVGADGFKGVAPVASFPANAYGLSDMAGNVSEWCADLYGADYYTHSPRENPPGPARGDELDPAAISQRVIRGGSFLCSDLYCKSYRPSARRKNVPTAAFGDMGFRCARDAD
jgi:formylglycine-generating enzyme required for sulfatase activity